jgi:beta-N-acetylhexosaminidase
MLRKSCVAAIILVLACLACTKKTVKPPPEHIPHPVEAVVITILKTEAEENREELRKKAAEIVAKLPLDIRISQMILSYPPSYDFVEEHQIGGIILNQNFIKDSGSTVQMVKTYNERALIPLFFAIDQEGGLVNRLKHIPGFRKTPSPGELGKTYTTEQLTAYGYKTAKAMNQLGINVNLAPSLDLSGAETALMVVQERSLGNEPATVLKQAEALITGYHAGGILSFVKHYPGYSDVAINSDVTVAHFNFPPLKMVENYNLFATLSGKVDGIMMSSVIYADFDSVPALFSSDLIKLIRLSNPDILVITDDLYAPALRILEEEDLASIARKTFLAGNDILLILWDIKALILIDAIREAVTSSPGLEKRLDQSVVRILLSKERIYPGLMDTLYKTWVKEQEAHE